MNSFNIFPHLHLVINDFLVVQNCDWIKNDIDTNMSFIKKKCDTEVKLDAHIFPYLGT